MSYEALAIQMKHAGCPINASGLYRIEKGDPPRRITVDELVAFAQVFGVPVEELLLPPEAVATKQLAKLVSAWNDAQEQAVATKQQEVQAWEALSDYMEAHPDMGKPLAAVLREWSEFYFEEDHEFRVAYRMWKLTSDRQWGERARSALDLEEWAKRNSEADVAAGLTPEAAKGRMSGFSDG